jgi:S-sulfo-L-cysteine synthase (3-phospho-L-serine-dependent)
MRFDSIIDAVGHTPVVRLSLDEQTQADVYAKLEMQNMYGMKDRVAKQAILHARRTGELRPGGAIVESSSGTMALGAALVGTALGHPVHIVTDPRIDPLTLAKLRALGAQVHVVTAMTGHGWQSARLERLEELMRDMPGSFWPCQYSNPQNPLAYEALATELLGDLGQVDVLVGTVGSGGSLCGTARAIRSRQPELRVIGIDCVGSVLFGQPDRPGRLQSGLGNSLLPGNLDPSQIDEVHWLSDREAFDGSKRLAAEQGIFAGNTSGSVYQVLSHIVRQAGAGDTVVGLFPDRGDRYHTTIYSDEYWRDKHLNDEPHRDEPVRVDYGTPVSQWSFALLGGDRDRRGSHDVAVAVH